MELTQDTIPRQSLPDELRNNLRDSYFRVYVEWGLDTVNEFAEFALPLPERTGQAYDARCPICDCPVPDYLDYRLCGDECWDVSYAIAVPSLRKERLGNIP